MLNQCQMTIHVTCNNMCTILNQCQMILVSMWIILEFSKFKIEHHNCRERERERVHIVQVHSVHIERERENLQAGRGPWW